MNASWPSVTMRHPWLVLRAVWPKACPGPAREPIARVLRKDPVKCRLVFEPLPGKRPSGFASVNTVKPVKVLSRGLCFIGVQRAEEMPPKEEIGKRNNSARDS